MGKSVVYLLVLLSFGSLKTGGYCQYQCIIIKNKASHSIIGNMIESDGDLPFHVEVHPGKYFIRRFVSSSPQISFRVQSKDDPNLRSEYSLDCKVEKHIIVIYDDQIVVS